MTTIHPRLPEDARLSTNEAAKVLGVTRQTINTWAKKGKIKKHIRKTNGRSFYRGGDINRLWISEI